MRNIVNITGRNQGQLSVSATSAETAALSEGLYDVWASVDVYIKTGASPLVSTTSNGYLLRTGTTLPNLHIQDGHVISAIAASAGTLSYHKVSQ